MPNPSAAGAAVRGLALMVASWVGLAAVVSLETELQVKVALADRSALFLLAGVGSAVCAAGVIAIARIGRGTALTGVALAAAATVLSLWPLATSDLDGVGSAVAAAPLLVPAVGQVAWGWQPGGRTPWAVGSWVLGLGASAVLLLGYDGYRDVDLCTLSCVSGWAPWAPAATVGTWLAAAAAITLVAVAATVLAVLRRRATAPQAVLWASLSSLAVLGVVAAATALRPTALDVRHAGLVLRLVVVLAVGAAALAAAWNAARVSARLSRLVAAVEDPDASTVGAGPGRLQFALPGGLWVEEDGASARGTSDSVVLLRDLTGPLVRLADGRVDLGARLGTWDVAALTSAREAALTRAHRRSLVESQRRIVEANDRERRRIEADLHDGAQQRLVSVKLHLALAARLDPSAAGVLSEAEGEVQQAITALRELVHGGVPRTLETEGLAATLRDLTGSAPVRVSLRVAASEPPLEHAVAVWSLVSAGLRMAAPEGGDITVVVRSNDDLVTTVWLPGVDAEGSDELGLLRDRFGALGGQVTTHFDGRKGTIMGVLPCG